MEDNKNAGGLEKFDPKLEISKDNPNFGAIIREVEKRIARIGVRLSDLESTGECRQFVKRVFHYYRSKEIRDIVDAAYE